LLLGASEDDRVNEGGRMLEHNVHAQWIIEADDEELNLLRLRQGCVATGEGDEALEVLVHPAGASKHGKLPNGAIDERWPKVCVH
jgi:hypothetical protein